MRVWEQEKESEWGQSVTEAAVTAERQPDERVERMREEREKGCLQLGERVERGGMGADGGRERGKAIAWYLLRVGVRVNHRDRSNTSSH